MQITDGILFDFKGAVLENNVRHESCDGIQALKQQCNFNLKQQCNFAKSIGPHSHQLTKEQCSKYAVMI